MKSLASKAVCLFLVLALSVTGCASGNTASSVPQKDAAAESYDAGFGGSEEYGYDMQEEMPAPEPMASAAPQGMGSLANTSLKTDGEARTQKVIRNASMSLETKTFDESLQSLTETVDQMGGYIQSTNVEGKKPEQWGDSGRYAYLVARIPAERLDEFLGGVSQSFSVISQSTDANDITSQYYDVEGRKKTYETQLARLEAILTDAATLADVLALETEIARVRYEIESLETELRGWDNQVNYSTVSLDIRELTEFSRPQASEQSLGERISLAFSGAVRGTGDFFQDALVWLVGALPALLILAIIILLLWLLWRKVLSKRVRKGGKGGSPYENGPKRPGRTEQDPVRADGREDDKHED